MISEAQPRGEPRWRSQSGYVDTLYEVEIVEGHRKGEKTETYRAPGTVGNYNPWKK